MACELKNTKGRYVCVWSSVNRDFGSDKFDLCLEHLAWDVQQAVEYGSFRLRRTVWAGSRDLGAINI